MRLMMAATLTATLIRPVRGDEITGTPAAETTVTGRLPDCRRPARHVPGLWTVIAEITATTE